MKTSVLSAALAAMLLAAGPAVAQEAAPAADIFIKAQTPTQYLAKDRLIGAKVKNSSGEIVGDIEDLLIDNDDHVSGVIMGVGGFLGIGEKKIAVKTSALQLEVTDGKMNVLLSSATKDTLKSAPAFERATPKKGILERVKEKARELTDKSTATAKEAYEAAKEKAGPAVEQAKEKAIEAYESAKETAKEAVDKAKEAASPATEPAPEAPKQ
jgi:ElaB/YqjD/DUF883 family membrane-anchored ribosome-binding protein